ncbi:MAG: hypothetical protein D6805_04210 [Planctomycetota bacterium]|nr:MAG: hypothetical protein D6805_04210 [Planctomycetota bacterium]
MRLPKTFVVFIGLLMALPCTIGSKGACLPFIPGRRFGISTGHRGGKKLGAGGVVAPQLDQDAFTNVAALSTTQSVGLLNPRRDHTATLLLDGRVLIVGGEAGGAAVGEAELYDQGSGEFTAAATLNSARMRHTATLLSNGNVVIAGGQDTQLNPLASIEVYDPNLNKFEILISTLSVPRFGHTATLYPATGQIIFIGGFRDNNPQPEATVSVDIFTPSNAPGQKIEALDDLPDNRAEHGAALLPGPDKIFSTADDRILVSYGIGSINQQGQIAYVLRRTFLVLDPAQAKGNQWRTPVGTTGQNPRWEHHSIQTFNANGDVAILAGISSNTVGGSYTDIRCGQSSRDSGAGFVSPVEIYRPLSTSSNPTPSGQVILPGINIPQFNPQNPNAPYIGGGGSVALLHNNGTIFIAGGVHLASSSPCQRVYSNDAFLIDLRDPSSQLNPPKPPQIYTCGSNYQDTNSKIQSNQPPGSLKVGVGFPAISILPGPDGFANTADDTILVCGGQEAGPNSIESSDVYTMPASSNWPP